MNSDQKLLYFFAGVFAFVFLWRRREAIEHTVRQVVVALVLGGIAFFMLWKGAGLAPGAAYVTALVIIILIRRAQPRRSRYVSARAKRQAIAKHEKETGKTYKRGRDELDHILPHSRGGGNAEDNLQVLPKKKNREKGARVRWWE